MTDNRVHFSGSLYTSLRKQNSRHKDSQLPNWNMSAIKSHAVREGLSELAYSRADTLGYLGNLADLLGQIKIGLG